MRSARWTVVTLGVVAIGGFARAQNVIDLPLVAGGQAATMDGDNFTVTAGGSDRLFVDWTPDAPGTKERRGVMEFSLAGLPAGAEIESAYLRLYVSEYGSKVGQGETTLNPNVSFFGYAGDGVAGDDDATRTGGEVARETFNDTGLWEVELLANNIQALADGGGPAIGLLAYPNSEALTLGVWVADVGTTVRAPVIRLQYSGGSPVTDGDFNGDGVIDAADLAVLDQGFALHLSGYGNGDFNRDNVIDRDDYALFDRALAKSAVMITAVPEPAVALMVPVVIAGFGRKRR